MKTKLLFTGILSATLLLGACGNEEESKTEDKKETVKADSDKQKDKEQKEAKEKQGKEKQDKEKRDKEQAKKDEQQDQLVEQTQQTNEQATDEQQTNEQPTTQEPTQEQQAEPTEQEKTKGNAEWAKENVQGGTDAGMLDPSMQPDGYYSNDQLDPETGLPKDDAIPHKVGEGPTDAEIAQGEKEALREKYNGGLSSGEMQTKTAIEKGYYDGDDADEVMKEIEQSEAEIANGDYDQYKE